MASEPRRAVHPSKGHRQRRPRNPTDGDPAPPAPADPGAASRASTMAAVPVASRAFSAAACTPRAPAPLASVLLHRGARGLRVRPPHLLLSRQMDAGLAATLMRRRAGGAARGRPDSSPWHG